MACDETGSFLAAAAGKMEHVRSSLQTETIACLRAIEGADDLGAQRVRLPNDDY